MFNLFDLSSFQEGQLVFSLVFTSRIHKLYENGLFVRWKKLHWPQNECAYYRAQNKTSSRALDLKDVTAAFAILGIGMGTATVILVIECIISLVWQKMTVNKYKVESSCP